jgi:hypothetical protein
MLPAPDLPRSSRHSVAGGDDERYAGAYEVGCRLVAGAASLSICSHLPPIENKYLVNSVRFPLGHAVHPARWPADRTPPRRQPEWWRSPVSAFDIGVPEVTMTVGAEWTTSVAFARSRPAGEHYPVIDAHIATVDPSWLSERRAECREARLSESSPAGPDR